MSSSERSNSPASTRLPVFPPSSLEKMATSRECLVRWPASASRVAASKAAIEPTWPSKLPPPGTESMCEPNMRGGSEESRPALRAIRLPARSTPTSKPAVPR